LSSFGEEGELVRFCRGTNALLQHGFERRKNDGQWGSVKGKDWMKKWTTKAAGILKKHRALLSSA
jgi:hypothetical protein